MSDDLQPEVGNFLSAILRGAAGLSLLFVPLLVLHGSGALLSRGSPAKLCFLLGLLAAAYGLWLCPRLRLDARLLAAAVLSLGCFALGVMLH